MKNFYITFLLLLLFISCSSDNTEPEITTKESPIEKTETETETEEKNNAEECKITNLDGLIIIEAENFELKGQWRIKEDEKASGGKYIEYYGPNSYNNQNLSNEITVKFTVDKASHYRVRWFMRQPDEAEGDKSNDAWIYLSDNVGYAWVNNADLNLEHYEKFVSRGKEEFAYGGVLDLHNPKASSWLTAKFPAAGEYTLKICARSEYFQLDRLVLSSGITDDDAQEASRNQGETLNCD
ncbi:hypothetical protein [uncultured Algibacter sp.]|uniref:hypothetical protein n=1 Tax=uncultured Algibacter sp. TaxID=298659 RepID=UPI0026302BAA|nr:hypothetical protein [uncultured Algibacter sp.]